MSRRCKQQKITIFSIGIYLIFSSWVLAQDQLHTRYSNIGRQATQAEVAAWDIDVRPDFKGLPKGSGSVAQGQDIWEAKCASCHGVFGESNEVFTPIIGGTTLEDIKRGRVDALIDRKHPQRTTFMKLATLSTAFDYIYRAMPWNAPRTLSVDETYSTLAYLLHLTEMVPAEFVLNEVNMMQLQNKMPNRDGMTTDHGLWQVSGKPDVRAVACMKNCIKEVKIESTLPDYARNSHHNLAQQNRIFGPYLGVDTTRPPLLELPTNSGFIKVVAKEVQGTVSKDDARPGGALFKKNNCAACHGMNHKVLGPSVVEISKKYQGKTEALATLTKKVKNGGAGVWGVVPMPANPQLADSDIKMILEWMINPQ